MDYKFITNNNDLEILCDDLKHHEWIAFDTEFIGENSFFTELCLIQVACEKGIYLLDVLQLQHIECFLDIIKNKNILKITHAGENDYRILFELYGITPQNIFDTQVAAGFIGYRFPISFKDLLFGELKKSISKSYSVVDWKIRPLPDNFVKYAIEDVKYLYNLYHSLLLKLEEQDRTKWSNEELSKFCKTEFYEIPANKDFFSNSLVNKLDKKRLLFLLRLINWRNETARSRNVSKESILQSKYIPIIVKGLSKDLKGLEQSRRLPLGIFKKLHSRLSEIVELPANKEEEIIISQIKQHEKEDTLSNLNHDILYNLVALICHRQNISTDLVLPRALFKQIKSNSEKGLELISTTWRMEFLGPAIINFFKNVGSLDLSFNENQIILKILNEAEQ